MFFKIVRNFKAKIGPFLLTLFLAPGYVHANTVGNKCHKKR